MASQIARLAARRLAGLPANPTEVVCRRAMSQSSKVLGEQEHAIENVYFQKQEHEKLEKLKAVRPPCPSQSMPRSAHASVAPSVSGCIGL
ncbi:hypothetical protein CLOP_g20438 [Closterium sp. NIES-67]|nr:hypothetical protein CLOP_g20438 [Closterium sp. NIES-67]